MALITAWIAHTQILNIDRNSLGKLNDTLGIFSTWVNTYTLEFVTGIIIQNVVRKMFLEKKGRIIDIVPRFHTFILYDFKYSI